MATRERPADLGAQDAKRLLGEAWREVREARIAAGLSQAVVGRAAGLSPSAFGRMERGERARVPFEHLARAARVVGLEASLRLYPAGAPVRDAGQLRLEEDLKAALGGGLAYRAEVTLPIAGDLRAWDGTISSAREMAFAECEMRLRDVQALLRRLEAKLRDDPRGRVLVLVVRDTRHNRAVLASHREVLRALLPLDTPAILRALRAGRLPPASGLLVLGRRGDRRPRPPSSPTPTRGHAALAAPGSARRAGGDAIGQSTTRPAPCEGEAVAPGVARSAGERTAPTFNPPAGRLG